MARVNTTKAVQAWIKGKFWKESKTRSIWTDGETLFSYDTRIGKWSDADGNMAIVNMEKYSKTTTCQQFGVLQLLRQHGKSVTTCSSANMFRETER